MTDDIGSRLEDLGWTLEVDDRRGELSLIHHRTERRYVFDEAGNLTIPGDGDIGGEITELHELFATAFEDEGESTGPCDISCEQPVTIESEQRISLDAPAIDIAGRSVELSAMESLAVAANDTVELSATNVDMTSDGNFAAEAGGIMDLDGAMLLLN